MTSPETKRRASQFADDLMPRNIWFLAYTDSTEAAVFPSQAELISFCESHLDESDIRYAASSCLDIRTGVRAMSMHTAADVLVWLEEERAGREAEQRFMYRDRVGVPA